MGKRCAMLCSATDGAGATLSLSLEVRSAFEIRSRSHLLNDGLGRRGPQSGRAGLLTLNEVDADELGLAEGRIHIAA